MILSMTGYGKAETSHNNQTITVELRSLNSKGMDLSMKYAPQFREAELDLRSLIAQRIERGKVDCVITLSTNNETQSNYTPLNKSALKYYISQLSEVTAEMGIDKLTLESLLPALLRLPDVTRADESQTASKEDIDMLKQCMNAAIDAFIAFRKQEGAALYRMFDEKLTAIEDLIPQVEQYETERISAIRDRLESSLTMLSEKTQSSIDKNRLEQEMIYYLEKLDITEEKVRLRNHIRYFRETMDAEGNGVGKKLGFIAQEMGREINTLGSKSNHSEMQILVVKMKDLLEQIKEQVLNVL